MKLKKLFPWCLNKFHYYVVFSKSITFILGLIFSYRLVDLAVFGILITHLTDEWKHYTLPKAASVVNLHEGAYSVLHVFFAFLADAYTGHFNMVVCSATLYIIGLSLFHIKIHSYLCIFYTALVLVTFSQAAIKVTLEAFLGDQLLAMDHHNQPTTTEENDERALSRCEFWWNLMAVMAAVVAELGLSRIDSFMVLTMVSTVAVGVALCWFLSGTKFYYRAKPTGSPLSDVVYVVYTAAVTKRNVKYPRTPEQLYQNSGCVVQISPQVSWLRWLDRAAVLAQDEEEEEEKRTDNTTCTVEQVKGVKFLLKMLPIWSTFLTFSLVSATGSTFFLEEASNILEKDNDFSILLFIILRRFTRFTVAKISDYTLEKLEKRRENIGQKLMLARIGLGMICCVLCCVTAWTNARRWLHSVKNMHVFSFTPQFMLLGLMEGLSEEGLEDFFDSQVSKSMARYGPPFEECVEGIGKFLSAVCILVLTTRFEWFNDDINSSRLDKYYVALAILSFVNMIVYWSVAYWYGDNKFLSDDDQVDVEMPNSVRASQDDNLGPLVPRSLSIRGRYESFSGRRIRAMSADRSSGDDRLTENTVYEREDSLPLLSLENCQENVSSCDDNEHDDHEMETIKTRSNYRLQVPGSSAAEWGLIVCTPILEGDPQTVLLNAVSFASKKLS